MGNPLGLHHAVYKTPGQIRSKKTRVENLFQDRTHVHNLSKDSFRELLIRTMEL